MEDLDLKMMAGFLFYLVMGSFHVEAHWVDKDFCSVDGLEYKDVSSHPHFVKLFSSLSPAPSGFTGIFGEGPYLCRDVEATYLMHRESKKKYVIFATQDDYCDGGNTIGVILDLSIYRTKGSEDAIVAYLNDSEIDCLLHPGGER